MGVKRKPILSLQVPGESGRYEDFHRVECDSMRADDLHAALDRIIAEPATTRINPMQKAKKWRRQPVIKGDEDREVREAVAGLANAVV